MKKLSILIIIFVVLMGYGFYSLFHNEPTIKPVTDSNFEGSAEHIRNMRQAFTGDWKTQGQPSYTQKPSQIQIARNNLIDLPANLTGTPKLETPEKKKTDKKNDKKKKTAEKKKPTKYERYVSRTKRESAQEQKPLISFASAPAPVQQVVQQQPPKKLKTVSEWLTSITNPINNENLNNLILNYQSRLITAPIFYGVIDKLMDSKKPEIQKMAITALAATPSPASFERLVELSKDAAAKTALQAYKKVNNLSILNQVLTSRVPGVQTEALTLIQDVANEAFNNQPNQSGTPAYTQAQLQQVILVFTQSLRILQTIAGSNPNPLLQQTIEALQNLLKA